MKKTAVEKFRPPYNLHDMNIIAFEVTGNDIILRTQSGIVMAVPPYSQRDGYAEIHGVRWEYSYVLFLRHTSDMGVFNAEMHYLKEFVENFQNAGFSVMDTTYCGDITKFSGFLSFGEDVIECIIEIYHEGDMVFVDEDA